ncbi:MAG: hypothetical protein WCL59_03755 [Cyanobium sp. ELA507]|jgi:hypothetical protein
MIFKPKFFLDLTGPNEDKAQAPAKVAPTREIKTETKPTAKPVAVVIASPEKGTPLQAAPVAAEAAAPNGQAPASAPIATGLTTAEAMAAELAAAQASRPAPSLATFAPEALLAGGATPMRRRRGGANLAGFREIARSFLKN